MAVTSRTIPLVENQDDGTYLLGFEVSGVRVELTDAQLDDLMSRALAAKMLDPDDEDRLTSA